jgi:cobalt-zinc-cadmium efflux system protein
VKQTLLKLNFVADLHHFHLWSLDGEFHVLTLHLSLDEYLDISQQEALKLDIKQHLAEFILKHTTIKFEWPDEVYRKA